MSCKNVCKLCSHLVISTAVSFTDGNLVITLPAGSYNNGEKYCVIVAQTIPSETTIGANVVFQIGDGTVLYPLTKCNCAQVTACGVRTRTKYSTVVSTSAAGGSFRLLGKSSCAPDNRLASINGTAPSAPAVETAEFAIRKGVK